MNPIPLNDRGQFRYTDLVGYIPDYLKEEPDVVELLQIFSDYMNNAYRNIESVEKFDFKLCVAETVVNKAKKKLEAIRSMFEVASGRADRVAILSVPRSNVKNNDIFSRASYPYTMDVSLDTVPDTITGANIYDSDLLYLTDGDVVYVTFANISGSPVYGYYVQINSATSCDLIRDPMGSSQDPFTGTSNSTDRMVTFNVSDISSVYTRFGHLINGCKYYEVFFTATVSNVESADTFSHCDLGDAKLAVDYYGMHAVPGTSLGLTQYYTSIGFCGGDGWAWKDGYPTAIIYLIDSSVSSISGKGDSTADPMLKPGVLRYAVDVTESSGQGIATSTSMIPTVNNMLVSMSDGDGNSLGRFTAEAVDGNPRQVRLTPYDGDSKISTLTAAGHAFMTVGPLFYSKAVGDIAGWASVRMAPIESDDSVGEISAIYSCCTVDGDVNVDAGTATVDLVSGNSFHLSGQACAYVNSAKLYCENTMWDGILEVASWTADDTGYTVSAVPGTLRRSSSETSMTCNIHVINSGFITVSEDGSADLEDFFMDVSDGEYIVLKPTVAGGESYYVRVRVLDTGVTIDCTGIAAGTYDVSGVDLAGSAGVISAVDHRDYNVSTGDYTVVASKFSGDVYGGEYYVLVDMDGAKHVYYNLNGINRYSSDVGYRTGDLVSYDGLVYKCLTQVQPGEDLPSASQSYADVTSEYRYYNRNRVINEFMPFYGQIATLDYDEQIDYDGIADPDKLTLPLYICKAEDIRLKYGWEHREYMRYPTTVNRDNKARNGYVELYETDCPSHDNCFIEKHDAVRYRPANQLSWNIHYTVVKRGCRSEVPVQLSNLDSVSAYRDGSYWIVTIRSSAHGLVDGCEVSVSGFPVTPIDINAGYTEVTVIDGDTFTYRVEYVSGVTATEVLVEIPSTASITYVADYRYVVAGVPEKLTEAGIVPVRYNIPLSTPAVGISNGDTVKLEYMFAGYDSVTAIVDGDTVAENAVLTVVLDDGVGDPDVSIGDYSRVRGSISEGDVVMADGSMYRVASGTWPELADDELALPITLFSKDNLMDIADNNPSVAMGPKYAISTMSMSTDSVAVVTVKDSAGFSHFVKNPDAVEMHTMVYIENASPSEYNGWHLVTGVDTKKPGTFYIRMKTGPWANAFGPNNTEMTVREVRWYKYTVDSIDWTKVSNKSSYVGSNTIVADNGTYFTTRLAHGLKAGDRVVFADPAGFASYSADNDVEFACGRVVSVISATKFSVVMTSGTVSVGNGFCRGLLLDGQQNSIFHMSGEYTTAVYDDTGEFAYTYRFMDGDVVVAKGQYNEPERMAYMVRKAGSWTPIRAKRAMKISSISVDQYRSQSLYDYYDADAYNAYTYETYSDVDVASYAGEYIVSGMHHAANANFYAPALSDLDSTRNMMAEYSSGEDYSNVAPRSGMDSSFKGVPDMKYPLAERIERLCYLRDPYVIDYDLIGYLARFMGYDITPVGTDIEESAIYRTRRERENAVRTAIANLPQYYALGGTEAGMNMLLETFGVIGRVITLWTNTESPYTEMISSDEIEDRLDDDLTGGSGTWAPTPYIDLELIHDERFPQFECSSDDIARVREQIRTAKPINVVFRNVVEKYLGYISCSPKMTVGPVTESYSLGAISGSTGKPIDDIDYGPESVTNCAF